MFIPPANLSPATAPRLLEGPRNVAAMASVQAVREGVPEQARRRTGGTPQERSAPDAGAAADAGDQPLIDRTTAGAAAGATYVYLTDREGRIYLIDADGADVAGKPRASASSGEAPASSGSALAERALRSYAAAARDFAGATARLSVYV